MSQTGLWAVLADQKEMKMYKKILVPLDGSPLAEAVLPYAQSLAKSEHAEIVLLRVALTPDQSFLARNPAVASNAVGEIENEAVVYTKAEVSKLKKKRLKVSGVTREGPIPDVILTVAKETKADVIAMSTHGRSGIERWLVGSVADQIVHDSPIPVMLIHPN
jgi:nucleotide-binding universal stress UspA family protein